MRGGRRSFTAVAVISISMTLLACGDDDGAAAPVTTPPTAPGTTSSDAPSAPSVTSQAPTDTPSGADLEPVVTGVVATDLNTPWGVAFLPSGDALVADRNDGHVVLVRTSGEVSRVGTVPGVAHRGEGGLLGLAVAPDFAANPQVYAYFTAVNDNRIVRMPFANDRLGQPEVLLDGIPSAGNHNGGRIAFGPDDGMLYATAGERGDPPLAQDLDSLGGKILRMTPDGEPAPGNPFGDYIWSYGHRNPQGIAWDDRGRLWAAEFGQSTWDELNLIEAGANYGWPEVEGVDGDDDFVDPLAQWSTDEASPSGIAITGGAVYMASLRGTRLWQIPLEGDGVGEPRDFLVGDYGRLRTVIVAPDGSLWLTTSNTDGRGEQYRADDDDKILRVELRPRS